MTTESGVCHSGSGHTARMAGAVAKRAGSVNGVKIHRPAITGKA